MSITLIKGPMFSGKTTRLIEEYNKTAIDPHKTLLAFKSIRDDRTAKDIISTHPDKDGNFNYIKCKAIADSCEIWHYLRLYIPSGSVVYIFIDEAQFIHNLDKNAEMLANAGHHLFIAALNATWKAEPWSVVSGIEVKATNIVLLKSICTECGSHDAIRTWLHTPPNQKLANVAEPIIIGNKDLYTALCRSCYTKKMRDFLCAHP
jgi:thymidine kinase